MNCRDFEELLSAYADGEISRAQREFIDEHLSGCTGCREILAQFRAAGYRLSSLKDIPESPDIRQTIMSKIKSSRGLSDKTKKGWLRPAAAAAAIVAVIAILLAAQPWNVESPDVLAASIVRNSTEIQTVLGGEEIADVEVTTRIVDGEGNVLMTLVRTEERAIAARVNIDTRQVTEIVRVDVPDFQPRDEQKAIDVAMADSRVQELLTQGGAIGEVHLGYSIDIAQVTGPDGVTRKEGTVIPTALLTVTLDGKNWNIVVNPHEEKVLSMGQSQPSAAMILVHIHEFASTVIVPVLLVLGILILLGRVYNSRASKAAAGISSLGIGIVSLFIEAYGMSSIWWRMITIVALPAVGLLIGITDLRQRTARRWIPVSGIILCALALVYDLFHAVIVPVGSIGAIIGIAAVIAGVIVYAFRDRIVALRLSGKWLRPSLAASAVVIILVLALIQPWSVSPHKIIARAYSATEGLLSYRAEMSGAGSEGDTLNSTIEFVYPDRFHVSIETYSGVDEFIVIGDRQYVKSGDMSRNMMIAFSQSTASILSKESTLHLIDSLSGIVTLPDEKIRGIDCFHCRGSYDIEKQLEAEKARMAEMRSSVDEDDYKRMMEDLGDTPHIDMQIELWIGKDDNLIRQIVQSTQYIDDTGSLRVSNATMTFYDFNEYIDIEPPLDSDGQVREGWQLAGSAGSNEQVFSRSITTSTGSQEGYDDWEHQEVEYTITITNNSIETVRDVRVTISTKLSEKENSPLAAAEPEKPADIIAPGESRTFHARIPFDAGGYTKEEIIELQEVTTFLVDYTTGDGQERTQLIYTDAPYPTSIPPGEEEIAPYLEARQKVDFPIRMPGYVPDDMYLENVDVMEVPVGTKAARFLYGKKSPSIFIMLNQSKFDPEEKVLRDSALSKSGFKATTIQGITGYWRQGVLCRTDDDDPSTEYWNMEQIEVRWDIDGTSCTVMAKNVSLDELLNLANSMFKID